MGKAQLLQLMRIIVIPFSFPFSSRLTKFIGNGRSTVCESVCMGMGASGDGGLEREKRLFQQKEEEEYDHYPFCYLIFRSWQLPKSFQGKITGVEGALCKCSTHHSPILSVSEVNVWLPLRMNSAGQKKRGQRLRESRFYSHNRWLRFLASRVDIGCGMYRVVQKK